MTSKELEVIREVEKFSITDFAFNLAEGWFIAVVGPLWPYSQAWRDNCTSVTARM